MCCCAKPNINGQPGYSWDGKTINTHPINPPALQEGQVMLFDEPGRCGGMDSHCHHYRLIQGGILLVRHGGGDEKSYVSFPRGFGQTLSAMDSDTRYWILNAIHHAHSHGRTDGRNAAAEYKQAFVDGTLKKRRYPKRGTVKVWIETPPPARMVSGEESK